jgi:hypothetical protein
MRPSFSYNNPSALMEALRKKLELKKKMYSRHFKNIHTYNLVIRKLGESSLFFKISFNLLIVSNRRNASPTLNIVAKQFPIIIRIGGPGLQLS